jgi:dipeptidyl aminopeptidase/acylaminoacyl peptidase
MQPSYLLVALACVLAAPPLQAQTLRPLRTGDIYELRTVRDARLSPDGEWVAYAVSRLDRDKDASDTDLYMTPTGQPLATPVRLTSSEKAETTPRWSPDGRYLAFLSARDGDHDQVWLLDRRGGEATRLTDFPSSVSDMVWSPDGTRLALVMRDPDPDGPESGEDPKAPKPLVITRLQFKRDGQGYLTDRRNHVYVFDVATRTSVQVTSGPYDDSDPAWSPDGKSLAFVSNRTPDPDANTNTDIFIVDAKAGSTPRQITTSARAESSPVFTRDGASIVYVLDGDPDDVWYDTSDLGIVSLASLESRVLTPSLDRNVGGLHLSADGQSAIFLLEDGGNSHVARVPLAGGAVERLVTGERDVSHLDVSGGKMIVLESQPAYPEEVFRVDGGDLVRLTATNDASLKGIALGAVERFTTTSRDGTRVDGFLTRPAFARAGEPLPTILRIHGGPVAQYSTAFNLEWQMLAAQGFAVVAANPRGSSGYGRDFSHAIWADWGNKDFDDVMSAVDHVVAMGVADPERLGVGGWSYGGILTNYVIIRTGRFKAAISGASEVNYLSNYGTDHYQRQWEGELGLPWRTTDLWIRLSPFFAVEKVTTPTLILCGADDLNVPLLNSEQLYQALKRLGRVDTELVIYPGQNHGIRRPSFEQDRFDRYIAWYGKYLQPDRAPSPQPRF